MANASINSTPSPTLLPNNFKPRNKKAEKGPPTLKSIPKQAKVVEPIFIVSKEHYSQCPCVVKIVKPEAPD
jgi:hypothetical protein